VPLLAEALGHGLIGFDPFVEVLRRVFRGAAIGRSVTLLPGNDPAGRVNGLEIVLNLGSSIGGLPAFH